MRLDFDTFKEVLALAPGTRPGRYTVLDEVTSKDIEKAYRRAYE